MRILNVEVTNSQTNEKLLFDFGNISKESRLVTTRGSKLNKFVEFCFSETECAEDVSIMFSANGDEYTVTKQHAADGSVRSTLRKHIDGKKQIVARGKAVMPQLETLANGKLSDILRLDYINDRAVDDFHGDLTKFRDIEMLLKIVDSVEQTTKQLHEKNRVSNQTLRQLSEQENNNITKQHVIDVSNQLSQVSSEISTVTAELNELKGKKAIGVITSEILTELSAAKSKYQQLLEQRDEMDQLREQMSVRESISALVPKVQELEAIAKQREEYEKRKFTVASELEWQENELSNVVYQLEEKQRQSTGIIEKRSKIEVINQELQNIAELYAKNKELNQQLVKLTEQSERISAEKVLYKNKITAIENRIKQVKEEIDGFKIPNRTIGEILESVRCDVKIDEVQAQIDKLQSEIAIKESQIAEKESSLVLQVKRFKTVAELDVTVAPMKAKDTILQVLDAKYRKIELINTQLVEKQRNLQRAYEDFKYQILQIEQSLNCLDNEYQKTLARKQEEFKREVFLNSQKVYSDDASSVFAVSTTFNDEQIEKFKTDIAARNAERDKLLNKSSELKGKIAEIDRQIVINKSEMATLQQERNNINQRYNEIVAQNRSETVFNYLKAVESNNGTRYLLDVQQDAVKNEAELAEIKRNLETQRSRLASLQSRLRYLKDTQSTFDSHQTNIEQLVATNDQIRDSLSDVGETLLANYEQYRAVAEQLEQAETRLTEVQENIIEVTKTIKVNQNQIQLSNEKAKRYAGTDDLEQAITNFRYEIADVDSEKQMLSDSKVVVEKDVFKKRLELEKLQYLCDSKNTEYNDLFEQVQFELNLKGIDISSIQSYKFNENTAHIKKTVEEYDISCLSLAERIDNYQMLLNSQPDLSEEADIELSTKIGKLQNQINNLRKKEEELEALRQHTMSMYLASSNSKIKLAIVASEAKTLSELQSTLQQNEIVKLLIEDKIKSVLQNAQTYFERMTKKGFRLELMNTSVVVNNGGQITKYDDLETKIKYCLYISLILGIERPNEKDSWFIFDEKCSVSKETLSDMASGLESIHTVTGYKRTAPTSKPNDDENQTTSTPQTQAQPKQKAEPKAEAKIEQPKAEEPTNEPKVEPKEQVSEPSQDDEVEQGTESKPKASSKPRSTKPKAEQEHQDIRPRPVKVIEPEQEQEQEEEVREPIVIH